MARPNADKGPTRVTIDMFILDITKIVGADESMSIDLAIRATWKDPRLEGPAMLSFTQAWAPRLNILHERLLRKKRPELLAVAADGTVTYSQRWIGTLGARMDLEDFPLDEQVLGVTVVASHTTDEVELVAGKFGRADRLTIKNWEFGPGKARLTNHDFPPVATGFTGITYEFNARRYIAFFLWKLLLPLALIVAMSWAPFWIDPVDHSPQISLTVTSMLTLIAYRFVIGRLLPDLPFLTRIDIYVLGSTILVFGAMIQEVGTTLMARNDRGERARAVDRTCRWLFPSAFVAIVVAAFVI